MERLLRRIDAFHCFPGHICMRWGTRTLIVFASVVNVHRRIILENLLIKHRLLYSLCIQHCNGARRSVNGQHVRGPLMHIPHSLCDAVFASKSMLLVIVKEAPKRRDVAPNISFSIWSCSDACLQMCCMSFPFFPFTALRHSRSAWMTFTSEFLFILIFFPTEPRVCMRKLHLTVNEFHFE